jgi:tRNA dimethylallyltransferase
MVCVAILGPTASGKSAFAMKLAEKIQGEIISLDSVAVYKGFDIGSMKPSEAERQAIPHHLIDVLEASGDFSAFGFVEMAERAIADIESRNRLPFVVGGTYFYLRALEQGMYPDVAVPDAVMEALGEEYLRDENLDTLRMYQDLTTADPLSAMKIHPNDHYRLLRMLAIYRSTGKKPSDLKPRKFQEKFRKRAWMKYVMTISRAALVQRIAARADDMIQRGLIEETRELLQKYPGARPLGAVGYAEAVRFIRGELGTKSLKDAIIDSTRRLARKQTTWLRADPQVRFVDSSDVDRVVLEIGNLTHVLRGAI